MNKIEQELDKLKNELKIYQDEYKIVCVKRRQLKYNIQSKLDQIKTIEKKDIILGPNFIDRDINLCFEYIKSHKNVTSGDLINFLNTELKDKSTRWSKQLDSNIFMNVIGVYLKKNIDITFYNGVGNGGRRTTIWELK